MEPWQQLGGAPSPDMGVGSVWGTVSWRSRNLTVTSHSCERWSAGIGSKMDREGEG